MKNLVRGGAILVLTGLFVVFMYAQTQKESTLAIANDSLDTKNNTIHNEIVRSDDDTSLIKKTASVKAAGANRGSFSATAYCLSGRTAMGGGVRRGVIAADPRVLRLGSRVVINAGSWSGTYVVADTGSRVKGKKIDIWVPSCSEARRFGRRTVQIFGTE